STPLPPGSLTGPTACVSNIDVPPAARAGTRAAALIGGGERHALRTLRHPHHRRVDDREARREDVLLQQLRDGLHARTGGAGRDAHDGRRTHADERATDPLAIS